MAASKARSSAGHAPLSARQRAIELGAEHGLKAIDVFRVHERVMLAGHLDVAITQASEFIPLLELVVQPVLPGAA